MAYWNSGAIWNRKGNQNGFTWNSKYFLYFVRLNDAIKVIDGLSETLARLVLAEKPMQFYDTIANSALYERLETFSMEDDTAVSLLFALAEKIGIKDELTDYIVSLFLNEKWSALEDIKIAAQLLADDDFWMDENIKLNAYQYLRDNYGLSDDKITYFTELFLHDRFGLTDRTPKTAISDFLIGAISAQDKSFDYFEPIFVTFYNNSTGESREVGMRVDWKQTSIQVAPEAELTEISIPGCDGSLIADTTYRNRLFEIVCYSEDGLTVQEKEDLKSRICDVLDSTKNQKKKLTVQSRGTSFDVKYSGEAEIKEGPSYVKASIPLQAGPYGYDMFDNELYGSGLIDNTNGDSPLGPIFKISGYVANPGFTLGASYFKWNGTVPSGTSLYIDFDKMTCYLMDNFGKKTNALAKLSGEFFKIPAKESIVLVADKNTESRILTTWNTPVLW